MGPSVSLAMMLKDAREQAALTQKELAERSGLSLRAVGNLECGRVTLPRVQTLRELARALDLTGDRAHHFILEARLAGSGNSSRRNPADSSSSKTLTLRPSGTSLSCEPGNARLLIQD